MNGSHGSLDPRARWMRIDGDRRLALTTLAPVTIDAPEPPAFAFGFSREPREGETTWLGPAPVVVRPLRAHALAAAAGLPGLGVLAPRLPLLAPFGAGARAGVRAITAHEPRMTRLWERFSVDVGVAVERSATFLAARAFERPNPNRVLVLEDGDRYAMRALCMFSGEGALLEHGSLRLGVVHELLHDRSMTGMRAASHLLGLAVRALADDGADAIVAWSLPHSGSFPMFVRHGLLPWPAELAGKLLPSALRGRVFGVRANDADLAPLLSTRESWYLSWLDAEALLER